MHGGHSEGRPPADRSVQPTNLSSRSGIRCSVLITPSPWPPTNNHNDRPRKPAVLAPYLDRGGGSLGRQEVGGAAENDWASCRDVVPFVIFSRAPGQSGAQFSGGGRPQMDGARSQRPTCLRGRGGIKWPCSQIISSPVWGILIGLLDRDAGTAAVGHFDMGTSPFT